MPNSVGNGTQTALTQKKNLGFPRFFLEAIRFMPLRRR